MASRYAFDDDDFSSDEEGNEKGGAVAWPESPRDDDEHAPMTGVSNDVESHPSRSSRKGKRPFYDMESSASIACTDNESISSLSGMSFKPSNLDKWRHMPIRTNWLNPEWKRHEWLGSQFITHSGWISRDKLALRFFLLNHLSFHHACSWWHVTTLLESKIAKSSIAFADRYAHLSEAQQALCGTPFHALWRRIAQVDDHSRYEPNLSVFLSWHVDDLTWMTDCRRLTPGSGSHARVGIFESACAAIYKSIAYSTKLQCSVGMALIGFVLMTHYDGMIFDVSSETTCAMAWTVWRSIAEMVVTSSQGEESASHQMKDVIDYTTRRPNWLMCVLLAWKACRLNTIPLQTDKKSGAKQSFITYEGTTASSNDIMLYKSSSLFNTNKVALNIANWLMDLLRVLSYKLNEVNSCFKFDVTSFDNDVPLDGIANNGDAALFKRFARTCYAFFQAVAAVPQ